MARSGVEEARLEAVINIEDAVRGRSWQSLDGHEQVLATVRSPAAEIHCGKGEAAQIDWQDAAGWPTLVFHPP